MDVPSLASSVWLGAPELSTKSSIAWTADMHVVMVPLTSTTRNELIAADADSAFRERWIRAPLSC